MDKNIEKDVEKNKKLMNAFVLSMLLNLPDMVFVKNADLVYISASKTFANLVGIEDPGEIVGKTDAELFDDKDLAKRYREDDRRLIESGKPMKGYIEPSVSIDGNRGYYQTSKFPLFDEKGYVVGLYAISHDVTKEYKARQNYERELNALFELPKDAMAAALFDITNWRLVDFRIVDGSFQTAANYDSVSNFIKIAAETVVDDEKVRNFYNTLSQESLRKMFEEGKRHLSLEYRRCLPDNNRHWVRVDLHFLLDPVNSNLSIVWIICDIDAQKLAEHALTRAAEWDALTDVYNREATMTHIRNFLNGDGALGTHWLFMIDVDNFKLVNDTFGHQTGDETLVDIASAIRNVFRETDIVGRIGGDEFFALMKYASNPQAATKRAIELVEALQYICSENGIKVDLSGSVGISSYKGDGKTIERLYTEADSALYRAKQAGKNCFAFAELAGIKTPDGATEAQEPISAIHFRTLLENMDATMFQTDIMRDGDIRVSYSSHSLFAKRENSTEKIGTWVEDIWSVIVQEDLDALKGAISNAAMMGKDLDYTCRVCNSEGKMEWRHIRGTHLPDSDEGIHSMIHVATDITKQKQVESKLREKDRIIDFAMRNTDVNMWYVDFEKMECELPPSCQKAHEMPGVETLSNFPQCLFEMGYVREDCIERLRDAYERLHLTGEIVEFDTWFHKKDGSGWWCERNMLSPLVGADGTVTRGIGIGKNVTAEKELEEKFHTFQSYRSLAEKNTMVSARMNLTTGWCGDYANSSAAELKNMFAKTIDGFFEALFNNIPTEEEVQTLPVLSVEYLQAAFARGETSLSLEHRYKLEGGSAVWVRSVLDMMKNPANGDVEALYYAFDINYEKNLNFVVDRLLSADYEFLGLIDVTTKRLMVFGNNMDAPGMARNGGIYDEEIKNVLSGLILEEYCEESIRTMGCAHVINELESKEYYTCSFPARDYAHTKAGRKQWKFSYLNDSKSLILLTRTDITNIYTAERDPLTGLYNKETFYRRTKELLEKNPDCPFILIRFDIDRFKAYNDLCGVKAGDRLLAELGRSARRRTWPQPSVFGRLEADHFVSLIPADNFDIETWHQNQKQFIETAVPGYRLTSSVGIYKVTNRKTDVSLMCDRALLALRTVKDRYTHKLALYDESLREKLMWEQSMTDDMEQALLKEEFILYFQPLVNYKTGVIIGTEALVRWMHPKQGLIPPDDFIPLFEKNGQISKLDAYVWEKSCKYLRDWLDREEKLNIVPISVNISRCDLYDPDLCHKFLGLIKKYDLPCSLLRLEITESAYMEDPKQLIGIVKRLRSMGFTMEMDDFGAGYSSLNMLKDVPVDVLKLDTQFLSENEDNKRATAILSNIVHMALELNLMIIAEGVETKEQADHLLKLECVHMQGYYFGRPMPIEEYEKLILLD